MEREQQVYAFSQNEQNAEDHEDAADYEDGLIEKLYASDMDEDLTQKAS